MLAPTSPSGIERRRAERVATERPVQIHFSQTDPAEDRTASTDLRGTMLDISIIGAGFVSEAPVPDGETITLDFQLPNTGVKPLHLRAQSRRSVKVRQQYLTGVEFVDIPPHTQSQIRDFIARHHSVDHL
ncbi:MAG: PilZ domain-containing protein [Hydrogenovibrio sp.]|uniref:PilZ domain-containing protein n=1 Tax=Hydrogenovibrio sp. TaxID=2065821 RepID=UPI0028701066|nr:PilZ domain-containing protein [Hydrogenovibrio sp.]MDR9498871.1 PilZ domain-containing protein [Hydrogenovibrio sp.]